MLFCFLYFRSLYWIILNILLAFLSLIFLYDFPQIYALLCSIFYRYIFEKDEAFKLHFRLYCEKWI